MKNFNLKVAVIALFIAVCSFLCFVIAHPEEKIGNEGDDLLVSFLADKGIHLSKSLSVPDNPKLREASASSVSADRAAFAAKLLGGAVSPNPDGTKYTSGGDTVTFSDSEFSYSCKSQRYNDELADITIGNAGTKAEAVLNGFGFDMAGCIIEISEENEIYTASVTNAAGGLPIFNDTMRLTMAADGIRSIEGAWFTVSPAEEHGAKKITDALMQFVSFPERPSGDVEITAIDAGYVLTESEKNETELKPVWRLTLSDGKIFYMDA